MENLNEQIIELVHLNRCLYVKRDGKYKDVKYKENIWKDIAKQTNLSVKECKVKWKSLRDRYRKQKMAEDLPSGSSQKLGAPWKYMQNLSFLAESMEPASTIGNVSEELDTSVEWLLDDSSSQTLVSNTQPTRKRKSDDLFTEVLMAMKKKYEEPPKLVNEEKYSNFFQMLKEKFDKLDGSEVDNVQLDILKLVNQKIVYKK